MSYYDKIINKLFSIVEGCDGATVPRVTVFCSAGNRGKVQNYVLSFPHRVLREQRN